MPTDMPSYRLPETNRQVLLARMRDRGALLVEVDAAATSAAVVNSYLDIKQQSRL